ncbi:MAG: PQQ-dependent sugar dehydrogenase, partial [Saprospiraceae bacterium]|nr:PQQ-dependent sugar dehydrogenase [Saprospiraceae bacterium]
MKVYSQSDFIDQKVSSDLNGAVGIEFVDSNLWYVWERDGIIQIFIDEEKHEKPLLDISAEVSSAGDLGLLGMALHPHFKTNGFVYLLYTVEPNYLRHEGSEPFIQVEADEWGATIGRLTRYQVDTKGFMKVLPESRAVLLGDSIHNGIPVLAPAHGPGGL